MSGEDATFIQLERLGEHCQTLKVLVLDPSERGRPVTLEELRGALAAYLPLYPRARQRALLPPVLKGRAFWVDDPGFDLDLHVSERVLPAPGGRQELDDVCSFLASNLLDPTRPLWDATLVHGLEGGEQAVVFRLHHAMSDGMGVVRLFERVTSAAPRQLPEPPPADAWDPPPLPSGRELAVAALEGVPDTMRAFGESVRWTWRHRRALAAEWSAFRARDDLYTSTLSTPYTWLNPRYGTRRLCASGSLPLADFKLVKDRIGTTLNSVLLAVIAGALRRECELRGRDLDTDIICGLGMADDPPRSERSWGNNVSTFYVCLHTTEPNPLERLRKVARSATDTVALRRQAIEGRRFNITDLATRLGPRLAHLLAYRINRESANISAGNVPGPAETRYIADIRISDVCSYAILVLTLGMQLTVYSYDGAMKFGVLVAPEAHRHPEVFMSRLAESLRELVEVTADL